MFSPTYGPMDYLPGSSSSRHKRAKWHDRGGYSDAAAYVQRELWGEKNNHQIILIDDFLKPPEPFDLFGLQKNKVRKSANGFWFCPIAATSAGSLCRQYPRKNVQVMQPLRYTAQNFVADVKDTLRDGWMWTIGGVLTIATFADEHSFRAAAIYAVTRMPLLIAANLYVRMTRPFDRPSSDAPAPRG